MQRSENDSQARRLRDTCERLDLEAAAHRDTRHELEALKARIAESNARLLELKVDVEDAKPCATAKPRRPCEAGNVEMCSETSWRDPFGSYSYEGAAGIGAGAGASLQQSSWWPWSVKLSRQGGSSAAFLV